MPSGGLTQVIDRKEVRVTLSRMKKGETTEMDEIPDHVWMCLGESNGAFTWPSCAQSCEVDFTSLIK